MNAFGSRREVALLLAPILAAATGLRLTGLWYGLPLPVLNPDEENIVPRAWELVHGGGLDPGWYDYPSLLMLVLAPTQLLAEAPSYGGARTFALLLGLGGVVATWVLGRVTYGTWAGVVGAAGVAVATTHVAYSRMAVTDVLLTLGVTVALALIVSGRIEWAGVAAGLATSAKYPGAILVVPLVVASFAAWGRLARALLLAASSFALTSPFVLIHAGAAWDDVLRVQGLARAGWLGLEDDPVTPLAFAERVWDTLGPFAVIALAALVLALVRRARTDLVLCSFAIAYWLYLMPLEAHFDRYVLPLVPVLAVVVGSVRPLAPIALALLVVPLAWSVGDAHRLRGEDTRVRASAWVTANVAASDRVAEDPSTLPSVGRDPIRFELPGPGRPFDPQRDVALLRRAGVDWVIVTGAVADRVGLRADLYPREAAFYETLARDTTLAFAVDGDDPGLQGPWVRIYRLLE